MIKISILSYVLLFFPKTILKWARFININTKIVVSRVIKSMLTVESHVFCKILQRSSKRSVLKNATLSKFLRCFMCNQKCFPLIISNDKIAWKISIITWEDWDAAILIGLSLSTIFESSIIKCLTSHVIKGTILPLRWIFIRQRIIRGIQAIIVTLTV